MDEGLAYLLEQLQPLGGIRAKPMFGGYGIFCDARMFALVADQQLYFKVDAHNQAAYEARGLGAFGYRRGDKWVSLSYRAVPEELIDEPEALRLWAAAAIAAARRAGGV